MNDNLALIAQLQKQNRLLKQVLGVAGAGVAALLLTGAIAADKKVKFKEIDVERINIVTADGKREIVIANRDRLPNPVMDGKEIVSGRGHMPGMIFFNAQGDENGGFIFDGKLDAKGKPDAGMHFSMDRFGGDQQLSLGHYESGGFMESGMKVYDRGLQKEYGPLYDAYQAAPAGPEKEALFKRWKDAGGEQTDRLFVGKTRGKSSAVILADAQGRPKIMMLVSPEGKASLDFMDDNGKLIQRLPAEQGAAK